MYYKNMSSRDSTLNMNFGFVHIVSSTSNFEQHLLSAKLFENPKIRNKYWTFAINYRVGVGNVNN